MSDLSDYHSLQNKISELERDIVNLANENNKLNKEVDRLNRRNVEWKCKYKKVAKKGVLETRTSKARAEISRIKSNGFDGTVISQIRNVAELFFLSEGHVTDLWYKK